uniref:Uncharacterized protein n=1 Tax=Glossina pallidipes TaxID=7398 RepID=A0A1A9ZTX6_GLOPL
MARECEKVFILCAQANKGISPGVKLPKKQKVLGTNRQGPFGFKKTLLVYLSRAHLYNIQTILNCNEYTRLERHVTKLKKDPFLGFSNFDGSFPFLVFKNYVRGKHSPQVRATVFVIIELIPQSMPLNG